MPVENSPVIDLESIIHNANARQRQPVEPDMWCVLVWNDPVTPFGFVTHVLRGVFRHDEDAANAIMIRAHTNNFAVCAVHPKDLAETKQLQASQESTGYGYPLQFTVRKA